VSETYTERLNRFKHNEKPEVVLLLADNPDGVKLILAWANTKVERHGSLTELKGEGEADVWDWLWENSTFCCTELIEKSGLHLTDTGLESRLRPLIGNRLLYPDGTVNSFVQRYLRERVLKLFQARSKKLKER